MDTDTSSEHEPAGQRAGSQVSSTSWAWQTPGTSPSLRKDETLGFGGLADAKGR
jgi:hypothetical protein